MAGWQLAARACTVAVARGGDGGALLLGTVTSLAPSLGAKGLLTFGATDEGASLLAVVESPNSSPKAPSAGSLGIEKNLLVAALVADASLLAAIESTVLSVAGAAALVPSNSETWMIWSCRKKKSEAEGGEGQ